MARRFTWEPKRSAIRAIVHRQEVADELASLRSEAAAATRRVAPRGPTGMYAGSIVEGPIETRGGEVSTTYGSTDFAAHIVERGSVNNPPYMPLHRGAQAVGLRVEDV